MTYYLFKPLMLFSNTSDRIKMTFPGQANYDLSGEIERAYRKFLKTKIYRMEILKISLFLYAVPFLLTMLSGLITLPEPIPGRPMRVNSPPSIP